ncbi:hypothetical protein SeMB42_g05118 [Synchytrium endobioticum]|uniref:Rho-GAP domain-containing protein n=1 Tax=Synchytrium endobioticum TaxID=286115 RepID=A0A507CKQ0_9FUNG|nr:hypothetical protein SeLEV6574_g06663 [Synchytrium endobioticum]TPX42436.1 hypothetical protein SeMB42_g05118 [Synchytrium endobioticum]
MRPPPDFDHGVGIGVGTGSGSGSPSISMSPSPSHHPGPDLHQDSDRDDHTQTLEELLQSQLAAVIAERNALRLQNDQLWKIIDKQRQMILQPQAQCAPNHEVTRQMSVDLREAGTLKPIRERSASDRQTQPRISTRKSVDNVQLLPPATPSRRTRASSISSSGDRGNVLPPLTSSQSSVRKPSSTDIGSSVSRPTSAPGEKLRKLSSRESTVDGAVYHTDDRDNYNSMINSSNISNNSRPTLSRPVTGRSRSGTATALLPSLQPQPPTLKRGSSTESPRHKDRPKSSETSLKLNHAANGAHRIRSSNQMRKRGASVVSNDSNAASDERIGDAGRARGVSECSDDNNVVSTKRQSSVTRECRHKHRPSTSEVQGRRLSTRSQDGLPNGDKLLKLQRDPIPPIPPNTERNIPATEQSSMNREQNETDDGPLIFSTDMNRNEQSRSTDSLESTHERTPDLPDQSPTVQPQVTSKLSQSMDDLARLGLLVSLGGFDVRVVAFNLAAAIEGKSDTSYSIAIVKLPDRIGGEHGEEMWRIQKYMSDILDLDRAVRQLDAAPCLSKLPERSLLSSALSPAKIDERKLTLELFLQAIISNFHGASLVMEFFSTDITDGRSRRDSMGSAVHKAGYLFKKGKNFGAWKTRYFVLMDNTLHYSEFKDSPKAVSLRLDRCAVSVYSSASNGRLNGGSDSDYRHAFSLNEFKDATSTSSLTSPVDELIGTRTILCAESDEDRDEWVEFISGQVAVNKAMGVKRNTDKEAAISYGTRRITSSSTSEGPLTSGGKTTTGRSTTETKTFTKGKFQRVKGETPYCEFDEVSFSPKRCSPQPPVKQPEYIPPVPPIPQHLNNGTVNVSSAASVDLLSSDPLTRTGNSSTLRQQGGVHASTGSLSPHGNASDDNLQKPQDEAGISNKKKHTALGSSSKLISSFLNLKKRPSVAGLFGNVSQDSISPSSITRRPCFGVSLEEALEAVRRVNERAELPAVVSRCIDYLNDKGGMSEEGIYRMSGSATVIQSLKERFDTEGDVDLVGSGDYYDMHAIAGLLKLWLRELTTPILTKQLQPEFLRVIELPDKEERLEELYILVRKLPRGNLHLLRALINHLVQVVANSNANKMVPRNVGIVFAPTLGVPAPVFTNMMTDFNFIFGDRSDSLDSLPSKKQSSASSRSDTRQLGATRQSMDSMVGNNSTVTAGSSDMLDNVSEGDTMTGRPSQARRRNADPTKRSRREQTMVLSDDKAQAVASSIDQMARSLDNTGLSGNEGHGNPAIRILSNDTSDVMTPPVGRRRSINHDPARQNRRQSHRMSTILYTGDADPTSLFSQFADNDLPADEVLNRDGGVVRQEPASTSPSDETNRLSIRSTYALDRGRSRLQNSFNSDVLLEGREDEEEPRMNQYASTDTTHHDESGGGSSIGLEKSVNDGSTSSFDY